MEVELCCFFNISELTYISIYTYKIVLCKTKIGKKEFDVLPVPIESYDEQNKVVLFLSILCEIN